MSASQRLTVPQVAQLLRVSIPYAQRLLREGKIGAWKDPQGWCTTASAVAEYVGRQPVKATKTSVSR